MADTIAKLPALGPLTYSELSAVTDTVWKKLRDDFNKIDLSTFDWSLLDMFNYEGFDPVMVYKHLALRLPHREKKQSERMPGSAYTESNKIFDFVTLINLFLQKGNLTVNNFKSFKKTSAQFIMHLITDFNISLSIKAGEESKSTVVTLQRIASAFPFVTCQVAVHQAKSFTGPFGTQELPAFMRCQQFCSLVPVARPFTNMLVNAVLVFTCDQAYVINKQSWLVTDVNKKAEILRAQQPYINSSLHSSIVDAKERAKCMQYFKVESYFKIINSVCSKAALDDVIDEKTWDAAFEEMYKEISGKP